MEPLGHRNHRVVEAARLHRTRERRLRRRTLIEGPNLLEEAFAAGIFPESVFALPDDQATSELAGAHGLGPVVVDEMALGRLAGTRAPRGPVAVIEIPGPRSTDAPGLLVAWGVSDPGNLGTLVRTAAAFGWDFAHTPGSADPWAPKVLRSGAGAHFRTGIRPVVDLGEIEQSGYATVAAVVSGGTPPADLPPGRYGVLIGEEAAGLPTDVVSESRVRVTIPMPGGVESLNAAVAAGIVVYELSKPVGEGGRRV